jgi:hypothetical protein
MIPVGSLTGPVAVGSSLESVMIRPRPVGSDKADRLEGVAVVRGRITFQKGAFLI